MITSIVNLILSPFCILIFLLFTFGKESKFYVAGVETNVSRLKLVPYLIYNIIYVILILGITYIVLNISDSNTSIWEVYQPKILWVSIITWLISLATITTFVKGMEGNIMGFIFFPMLLVGCSVLTIVNFSELISFNWQLDGPTIELNIWIRLLLHAFFPFYLLLLISSEKEDETPLKSGITLIISSLIIQMMIFLAHWTVFYILDESVTFFQYFGENMNIYYYLPAIAGLNYWLIHILYKSTNWDLLLMFKKISMLFCFTMILLQFINYIPLIKLLFD